MNALSPTGGIGFNPLLIGELVQTLQILAAAKQVKPFQSPSHRGTRSDNESSMEIRVRGECCFNPLLIGEVFRTLTKIGPLESTHCTLIFPDLLKSSLLLCQAKSAHMIQIYAKLLKLKEI